MILDIIGVLCATIARFLPRIYLGREIDKQFLAQKRWLGLILVYVLIGYFSPLLITYLSLAVVYFWEFYHYLGKTTKMAIFYSMYILMSFEYISFFIYTVFNKLIVNIEISFVLYNFLDLLATWLAMIIALRIFSYLEIDYELLESKAGQNIIRRTWPALLGLMGLFLTASSLYFLGVPNGDVYDTSAAIVVFFGFLMLLLYIQSKQREFIDTQHRQLLENQNHALSVDLDYLSQLYDEIRGFRHDISSIVGAMGSAVESDDMAQVKAVYHKLFTPMNDQLQSVEYTAFDLGHIEDLGVRNTLSYEMLKAKNLKVPFQLEVMDQIPNIMDNELSIVRIIDILLDNAIEAAVEAKKPLVEVALFEESEGITLRIRNTRKQQPLNQREIWYQGVSTKGDSRGIGLANVDQLMGQIPNVMLQTHIGDTDFTQTLNVERREDDDSRCSGRR